MGAGVVVPFVQTVRTGRRLPVVLLMHGEQEGDGVIRPGAGEAGDGRRESLKIQVAHRRLDCGQRVPQVAMHLDAPLPHRRAHNPLQIVEGEPSRDVLDFVNAGLVEISVEGTA